MVHKTANGVLDSGMDKMGKKTTVGIHKYSSTGSWLDERGTQIDDMHSQVDAMHEALDREYFLSEMRTQAAQQRIEMLQDKEESERQQEEEQLHLEKMRQIEVEKAQAEVKAIRAQIKAKRRAAGPQPVTTTVTKKSLKQKITKAGKTVAALVGTAVGHPEVALAAAAVPEGQPKTVKKTKYVQPKYTPEGDLVYGSWVK